MPILQLPHPLAVARPRTGDAPHLRPPLSDTVDLDMLLLAAALLLPIPPGEQTVPDAASGFQVTIRTGAFLLGKTEVTQAEYAAVMGANPSHYRAPDRPVENVSWLDAIAFANRLSQRENLTPCYDLATRARRPGCTGYRLPTSAEWARAYGAPEKSGFRTTGYKDAAALTNAEPAGTRPAAAGAPNQFGLHGMAGNVWEWCEDWYSPAPALDSIRDPQGPLTGIAKVIRGGSFLTGASQWNKGLLSSLAPAARSRFTGFRLARTVAPAALPSPADAAFFQSFRPAPLAAMPPPSGFDWAKLLGAPRLPARAPAATLVRRFGASELLDLAVEPAFPTRILVVPPDRKPAGRLPVVIVPYYDVDTPAGVDLGGRRLTPGGTRAYARLAAQRGMLAVAIRWYGEADGEGYDEAVFHHARRHPGVTPMGKWVFELQRLVDYLLTRPDVDPNRIGMIGHSLGGKMALYGAAFEPRIKSVVSSEPGISLKFSNYEDFWYLGRAIEQLPPAADHHDLVARIAPRPFLLIAGESADGDKSWPFLAAFPHAGIINHRTGHSPTEASIQRAMEWLERTLY